MTTVLWVLVAAAAYFAAAVPAYALVGRWLRGGSR